MAYRISHKAAADLEQIWLYTVEHWSVEQADRYLNLIFDEIEYLSVHPTSGKDYSHIREQYRCSKVKSHLIFYRTDNNGIDIDIIRVLHQRMDLESRLGE